MDMDCWESVATQLKEYSSRNECGMLKASAATGNFLFADKRVLRN